MTYEIINTAIAGIVISDDGLSLQLNVVIRYRATGADKTEPSSVGCSIVLSLESGERSTLLSEYQSKVTEWFQENYNL